MMELNFNISDWLKIPIKKLLPALWLFSGIMILLPKEWLQKLYLLEWAQNNDFAFGLIFVSTSCLMLVYVICSLKGKLSALINKLTLKRKTIKNIASIFETYSRETVRKVL